MALYPKDLPRPEWMPDFHPWAFIGSQRGIALTWVGRLADAEAQLADIVRFTTEDGSIEVAGWSSYQLALVYYLMGEGAPAAEAAARASEISERLGSPMLACFSLMAHVWADLATGEFETALAHAQPLNDMFDKVERHWAPAARMFQALCLLELGRNAEAAELAAQAAEGFTFGSIRHFEIMTWGVLARAGLRSRGAAALAEAEHALARAERLIDDNRIETLRPFLCEWRAEQAQVRGDAEARAALLDEAARLHAAHGAPRQAARLRSEGTVAIS
jgi:tetratricopeptide (TPR) repeat protein